MRTILQFIVLIVGGLLVLSGCASVDDKPIAQVENTSSPTATPQSMPQSEEVIASEAQPASQDFVFYNSHASW